MTAGFVYLWEYRVRPEAVTRFEEAYGPEGSWARLFRRHPGYLRTDLVRDATDPTRYVTIDHWRTRGDCEDFRETFAAEFEALDRECERYTVREWHLGDFSPVMARR